MSAEDFQLIDDLKIDDSIIKRDFIKIYHQHGAEVNNENQNIKFYFGENLNYIQIGNAYLEIDILVRKADRTNFTDADEIRLVNNALAYIFQEGRISTSAGTEIEHNKNLGNVSTIMRLLTQKDGDLSSYFDKIDEVEAGIANSTLKRLLVDSHDDDNNKGKIRANLPLEHIFGFCKTFKKITKGLGFELQLKTSNEKQNILYTTLGGNDVNVTINSIYLYIPSIVPSAEQQQMFNEAIRENFTLSFDAWVTDRKPVNTGNEYQLDIGSASNINIPLYLIVAHQKTQRDNPARPFNQFNNAIFDHVDVKRYFVEIDGVRYPKDPVETNFSDNKYLDQYRDLKLFYKEYNGESLLHPFISYLDMKTFYPIQVIDLRFQIDYVTPKKIRLFEEYENAPENTNLYVILIKHREINMVSDGNKITGIELI